ncbi:hypothetical protein QNI16_23795 [Cytophagaceae bacterium YF14B1]|uniref:Uncharacterized protein n=1 Tax=Xanthocytophaga flava TaxID=3048013 RepID=A0AAE3U9C5_9BACT|nr:hypothetical protein [Xanthocytophaga flavus]MDJ1483542.1 hypothetical protein [Xanthocytophaga flavus]
MIQPSRLRKTVNIFLSLLLIAFFVRIILVDQCVQYLSAYKGYYVTETDTVTIKHFENYTVGMGRRSQLHSVGEFLGSIAFSFELNQLAKAKDPTLKCYAFWLLSKRNEKELIKNLLILNQKDTTAITYSGPCTGWNTHVGELMLDIVVDGNSFPLTQILNQKDLKELGIHNRKIILDNRPPEYKYTDCCEGWNIAFGCSEVIRN